MPRKGLIWGTIKNKTSRKTIREEIPNKVQNGKTQITKGFWENDIFYLTADKGKKIRMLNKNYFYERTKTYIIKGQYIKWKNKQLACMFSEMF